MYNSSIQRIAKNTFLLYIRMIFVMLITLYTSRIVLERLGVEDYGIYNIVAGIVVLFAFLQTAMTNASQRYISYELGKGNLENVKRIFSMNMTTYISISVLVFIVSETIGLWFLNTQIKIPPERIYAANWVYQYSVFAFIQNIVRIPYNASIVAYEKMSFYAYFSVIEAILKLLIVFLLGFSLFDKLILYAFLLFIVSVICTLLYKVYCCRKFSTCRYHYFWDKDLYKSMLGFSGWTMLGGVANVSAQQGGNIILNVYSGIVANAAFAIANQVGYAVYSFSSGFKVAFNPQITKLYSTSDIVHLNTLIEKTSLLSYYLILVVALPFVVNADVFLEMWLGNVPEYAVVFCQIMIIYQMIDAFQAPLNTLIMASGKVRFYNLWLSTLIFLNIPVSLYLLSIGESPYYVLIVRASINALTAFIRIVHIAYFMKFPISRYLFTVLSRILAVTIIAIICYGLLHWFARIRYAFLESFILFLLILIIIYSFGVSKEDRAYMKAWIKRTFQLV